MTRNGLVLLSLAASPAFADILNVPGDFPTIQQAIDAANNGDEVVLAPGNYSETADLLGKEIVLRSSAGADATTIDGAGLGDSILLASAGETLDTVVRGITFRNGEGGARPSCVGNPVGGAVYIGAGSALSIEDCTFIDNGVDQNITEGGAIYVRNGSLRIDGCMFIGNGQYTVDDQIGAGWGGAIATCASGPGSSIEITRSDFSNNNASFGGALRFSGNSAIAIADSSFTSNTSSHGGAVNFRNPDTRGSELDIDGCIFAENSSSFGGALNLSASRNELGEPSFTRVADCQFVDNLGGFGGGVFASIGSDPGYPGPDPVMRLAGSVFTGNVANGCCDAGLYFTECFQDGRTDDFYGGAGDLRTLYGGTIEIANCLLYENDANIAGGFHLATCGGGEISLVNTTAANNGTSGIHVREGFANSFHVDGSVTIANGVFSGNGDSDSDNLIADIENHPEIEFETRYTLVGGGFAGIGNIDADPLFVGGGDYRIGSGSPAIDAGDNDAVPDGVVTDLAGDDRFVDDPDTADTGVGPAPIVDMGAYEFQAGDCPGDIDGDGDADAEDFFSYLDLFAAGDNRADIDGDGDLDAEDFFGYLDLFTQAC